MLETSMEVDILPWPLVEFTSLEISMKVSLVRLKLMEASTDVD